MRQRRAPSSRGFPREVSVSTRLWRPCGAVVGGSQACRGDPSSSHSQGAEARGPPTSPASAVPEAEQSAGSVASSPTQRTDRKKGCGALKRKLRRPPLHWGRKPPHAPGPALRAQRPLLEHSVSFSIHKGLGGGFPAARASGATSLLPTPGRAPGDPALGSSGFLLLLPPLRVGTHSAMSSLSLSWAQNKPARQVLATPFSIMSN